MSGAIRFSWVAACTERYLRMLLALFLPPVVVGMGGSGWRAVRQVFALTGAPRPILLAASRDWRVAECTIVFAVGHCGPFGLINRPWPRQLEDWRQIGEAPVEGRL